MQYAICNLGIVPLRSHPAHDSEMLSQVLYGETFKVLEERGKWSRIRTSYDNFEAWMDNKQMLKINEERYRVLNINHPSLSADLIEFVSGNDTLIPVPMGAVVDGLDLLSTVFSGNVTRGPKTKGQLVETAYLYLNAPFLWGGKTPFGIDSSGFTQMVYKLNGYRLFRSAAEQAKQGESLSFIEESAPGDLAFFDNSEGVIDHVGIMMGDNYIIHADGKVRLDRIDHSGIYNAELRKHTHHLRVIKQIF
jgi:gamma-D-glutamyl-L-lysine dipeptidyl-peptidase